MKISNVLFLFAFIITISSTPIFAQHSILGDTESCYSECKTYNLSGGVGGPYYWKSTGKIQGTNQGATVEICWNIIGSNSITLVDFSAPIASQIEIVDITVAAIPTPDIIPPKYPECGRKDSLNNGTGGNEFEVIECITACSESIAFYSFEKNNGAATAWEIDGGTVISTTTEGITIQWNPTGTGYIKLTETNSTGCEESDYYCVEILEPLDVDILAFNGGANFINVCVDQEVYLQALGNLEATNFEWNLGEGTFEYGTNITASYSEGGTYDIMLIGSSECKCFDTSYYQIIVDSNPGPEITCIGTTCGNEDHTYYAANTCGSYTWNVSNNGLITDGGGSTDDYVTINWTSGPVGTIGLTASACGGAVCPRETVVQIPILDGTATIDGPIIACKAGHSSYTMQYYNGTEYNWNIVGNGDIISGWGTNQITVQWSDNPFEDYNATIQVEYDNCYLECGGSASLNVDLKPVFDVSFSEVVCSDNNVYFNAVEGWNNAVVSWTVTSPSGVETTYLDVGYFNDQFTELGIYTITAIDNANSFCNEKVSGFFEVVAVPATPLSVEGPLVVCLNEYYNYTVSLPSPEMTVFWNITDGSNFNQIRSTTASIQWTSTGPYEIRVSYISDEANCRSEELIVPIQLAQNATITGPSETCEDEVETYSVGATNGTMPVWSITPSNAGSIIHNPDNTIDVMWHTPGNHQITSAYCGASLIYNVDVNAIGSNTIIYDEEICPGDITAITSIIPASSSVIIRDGSNTVIGTSINEMVSYGKYEVEITSIDGCIEIIPVVIDIFLPPSIRVSSPDENAFCLPHPEVSIVALDTKDGYTYEWFYNNAPLGATSSSISTNQYGKYHVQVTDKNGCTAISNTHRLYEWCMGDPPPGTCTGGGSGSINPEEINLTCNNLQFTVSGIGVSSTSFTWQFDDPKSGVNNVSTATSPVHEFTSAGYFYVFVQGNVGGEEGVDIFTIPAAPRFDYERACAGNDVQFRNHSTFIPGYDITGYVWNFGDPVSGVDNMSNLENPVHNYALSGTYNATLEITSSYGCLSTYLVEVIVEQGPLAEFILPTSACSNDGILFEAYQDDDIYTYEWNFDDLGSGALNTSKNPNAIHAFSSSGTYNVSLSVSDEYGCIQTISKSLTVTTTGLSGDIIPDRLFPMCFGEEAILTAPGGGDAYIWSDGSTGQTIAVSEPGIYYVTITENTGCDYIPDPINVVVEGIIDAKIRAVLITDGVFGPSHFDSLEICQGELFSMSTLWISGATYLWSTGHTSTYINEYQLTGYSPGRHLFNITITEPNSGCEVESRPFTLIVNAIPDAIQISCSSPNPCEGEVHTFTVDNPDPSLIYYWNNGAVGLSTTGSKGGSYRVSAKNKSGCERESNNIYVAPLPNANRINLGCTEACFPDTICIPNISGANGYQWLMDGSPIPGINGLDKDLIAEQAGDYQLVVFNYYGCSDTSDLLTIEALPSDQSVSGIVFIDDNNNGIWDVGEELLVGVPVNLFSGSVLETTIITDGAGYYNFDPVLISNPRIEIDTTGLGLNLTGGIFEGDVDFIDCIEDKEKNFPLIKECTNSIETIEMFTCAGETIIINNIVLQGGDTWTFDDSNVSGCDSVTYVLVTAFPQADVNLTTDLSCQDVNSGILDIAIMAGSGLQFAVDNNTSYTTNLQFSNLAPGTHMLWLTDENGCVKNYSFEIEEALAPAMSTVLQTTCMNENTGSAEIIPNGTGSFEFSLDGMIFSTNNQFMNLTAGTHIIYVQEDNNCIYEYPVVILANPEPQFDLIAGESCSTGASGTLDITPLSVGSFEYSLDNMTFSSTTTFNNLGAGSHILYVEEVDGCLHSYSFEIQETLAPAIEFLTTNTCEGGNDGSIVLIGSVPNALSEYEFSIDGITFSNDIEFFNLNAGPHIIYVLEDGVCQFQFPANIETQPSPYVTFDTEDACVGETNGSVTISTSELDLEYSTDQVNFSTSNIITDLDAGVHIIYVMNQNSCVHPFEVEIIEAGDLEVEFVDPVLDCSVQQVNLVPLVIESFGEVSYLWDTGANDSTIIANTSGQYSLSVTDKCSIQEYTWDIQIEEITKEQPIYFPNIFSPNQDGVNECFVPVLNPETTILDYRLLIFDRWGNKYFETTDMTECWDGRYNGKEVRTGVFVYLLEMDYTYCVEVESMKKYGDVTIVY